MAEPFYLTTPLYYVNARPHLGHAYTTIVADSIARAQRQRGRTVFLLTGTDEHGEKIAEAAAKAGENPQAFVDRVSGSFKELWKLFGISYDRFIRTTDPDHERVVQELCRRLHEAGLLKPGTYTFWYCVSCETGWTAGDFKSPDQKLCPSCSRPVEEVTEEDYFLHLEPHRIWLKQSIEKGRDVDTGRLFSIRPESRRNEALGMLEKALPPLCVTRPRERVSWGITVPFSPDHVTYVWFDALINYISALGWPGDPKFKTFWQTAGAVHLIGKDILRHHALYWPIILKAAGIEPPKMIFAHGWWLVGGEKMSKSRGNAVEPIEIVKTYGLDAFRYFLLRDAPFGEDGVFTEPNFIKRINSDLANDLGNLVYRTLTMIEKHLGGQIPKPTGLPGRQGIIQTALNKLNQGIRDIQPDESLKGIWILVSWANRRVEEKAPWKLAKEGKREELEEFLSEMADILRVLALFVWPFMPGTAEAIWKQLGCSKTLQELVDEAAGEGRDMILAHLTHPLPAGQKIAKGKPLFPRIDLKEGKATS
ncbi:MAG: methionine--tRNA ligase [Candidatus Omnitrophica bacterium CG11_big_fil_rev_8_21_14_0_20_64_10]|nr:MAG: methionine--tRNA ligase [Candidatus Omnitrophica bacterium CG11_big_fil_rev_8_21_14_0_20_64_10]